MKKFPIYYYNSKEKSIDFLELSYCIIITQDCDLTQDYVAYENKKKYSEFNSIDDEKIKSQNNKLIPSIMLVEGFPAEQLREGTHLSKINILSFLFGSIIIFLHIIYTCAQKRNIILKRYEFARNVEEQYSEKIIVMMKCIVKVVVWFLLRLLCVI